MTQTAETDWRNLYVTVLKDRDRQYLENDKRAVTMSRRISEQEVLIETMSQKIQKLEWDLANTKKEPTDGL
jgi:hypothetical protein